MSDDSEMIRLHRGGDKHAFKRLHDSHARWMYLRALKIVRDEHAAQDIVQDAFVKLHSLKEDPSNVRGWLCVVVKRDSLAFRRRARSFFPVMVEDEIQSGDDPFIVEMEREEIRCRVIAVMDRLFQSDIEVLSRFFFCGRTCNEIAELLDLPLGTVKSRLRTGLKNFASLWERDGVSENG